MDHINGEFRIKGKLPDESICMQNIQDDEALSVFSEDTEYEESSLDRTVFDSEDWVDIKSKSDKALGFLWGTGTKTYTTQNGVSITIPKDEEAEIYENTQTGEVIVIGAKDATITSGSKSAKITIYDSEINNIETGKGNDDIKIYNSEIKELNTGKGIDSVTVYDSDIKNIETGSGSDFVTVINSDVDKTNTSSHVLWGLFDDAEDTVIIKNSKTGEIKTGRGEDNIIATDSEINKLNTGKGKDSVSIDNDTDIAKQKGTKKDTVVENGNYLDIDTQKICAIESNVQIQIDEENAITVNEYVNYLLEQEIGFETEEEYQEYIINSLSENLDSMKSTFGYSETADGVISDGYNMIKELTGLGISDDDIEELISNQQNIIDGLNSVLNGESDMTFEEAYEYYTGTTYSQEKIDKYLEVSNMYSAIMVGCQYDEDYIDKFEEATGLNIEDVSREYALCQLDTFGKSTGLTGLVEKYSDDMASFSDKLSTAISVCGMSCILVGAVVSFVFPPAAGVGMGFMTAGRYISLSGMYIDNALDLIDDSTDENGLTKEELKNIALETGVETVSYMAGRGIGKFTNGLNSSVTSKLTEQGVGNLTSGIVGQAAETVTDTALSLGADYAIAQGQSLITTGEFLSAEEYWSLDRFLGEGKNQLMGILQGLASSKVSAYRQASIKTARDMILSGDKDGAEIFLKKSGMKMSDSLSLIHI